jgi:hypothetical protein
MKKSPTADVSTLLLRSMRNLIAILKKTKRHATTKKIDESVFMNGRLAPDMFNLIQQVQYVCFLAIEIMGPLSGKKAPKLSYNEKTIDECIKSLQKTIAYVARITPHDITRTNVRSVTVFWDSKKHLKPAVYLERVGIPDFFFHVTIAYGILRHLGVPLGKKDFIGSL